MWGLYVVLVERVSVLGLWGFGVAMMFAARGAIYELVQVGSLSRLL